MIFIGSASEEDKDFNYFEERIINAKDKIKEFPILNEIVKNFAGANKENCSNNFFLNLASSAVSDIFLQGQPSQSSEFQLKQFEDLLNEILPKLKSDKKEELKSRLKTLTKKNHFEKIIELNFYKDLSKNDKVLEINYEDKTKGNHDFNILLEDIEFNIEVTCLGKSKIEEILEEAFDLACNEIIKTLNGRNYLKLEVITDRLLENKNNPPEKIKEKIIFEYNKIKPLIFVVKNNFCIVPKQNLGNPEKTLFEILDYMRYYNEFGERILSLSKSEEGLNFLRETKIKDIQDNSFSCFYFNDAKSKLVTIHSQCQWPSKSESLRKISLLKQLNNGIREKIDKRQLKGKKNPFIAINFNDFLFHNYFLKEDYFAQESFNELKNLIQEIFREKSEREILGVLLYENDLKKSRFVENPEVTIGDNILDKIKLLKN